MRGKQKMLMIGAALLAIAVIGIALFWGRKPKTGPTDISAGIFLLRTMEEKSVDDVIHQIRESSGDLLREQYAERINAIMQDENLAWSMFDDFLFVGDSRCVAFVTYGFFNEENVLAQPLVNISTHLEPHIDDIAARNPGNLYLIYGFNDIECGLWQYSSDYARSYGEIVDRIHEKLPDTKIYVNGAIPVVMGRKYTSNYDGYTLIPDWNEAVAEMCASRDFAYYIDSTFLYDQYQDLYLDDGVHFVKEFYPHWAASILINQYQYELEEELESQAAARS